MKIGILTFHFACNYGAVLQCYALQRYLTHAGHDVSVVDYRPDAVARGYRWFDIRRFWGATPARFWRKTVAESKVIGSRRRRYAAFGSFVDSFLNLTVPVHDAPSMSDLSEDFDILIAGSDQIWNRRITGGTDPVYWGIFDRVPSTSLISYAASMEDALDSVSVREAAQVLSRFDALSVREDSLRSTLQPFLPALNVSTVADPTLLLDSEEWESMASAPVVDVPYLLFYQVRRSDLAREAAAAIAERRGLKPIFLSAKPELDNSPEVAEASPQQFVSLFRNASYVVTTSFHGTAFSIIFRKEFICVEVDDGKNSRQKNLLECLGLSGRIIKEFPKEDMGDVDWDAVEIRKDEMLEHSFEYLKSCGL